MFEPNKRRPYLALITETNACDSDERVIETYETIKEALGEINEKGVDLISIRVSKPNNNDDVNNEKGESDFQNRVVDLATKIMALKEKIFSKHSLEKNQNEFIVVVNDHVKAAIKSNADGVHVKETKTKEISTIRKLLLENKINQGIIDPKVIIGTSAHSIESAISSWTDHRPDYFFAGTCYLTQSHPEKDSNDLEGPRLPGDIKEALSSSGPDGVNIVPPIVFAIGGIDENNCHEPVGFGADGVAVIRGVMQATNPRRAVVVIKELMNRNR